MGASKVVRVGSVAQLRDGLVTLLGKSATLRIGGKGVKLRDILSVLDELLANAKATAQAKGAFRRAVADERAFEASSQAMLVAVRAHLLGSYSEEQLAACGIAPRKATRRLSSAERTAATTKVRATRAAHGRVPAKRAREAAALATVVATYGPHESGAVPAVPAAPAMPPTAAAEPKSGS